MIRITGVKKKFRQIEALKDVDLLVPTGTVTGLLGPNACGKTTLIKSILGLVVPDQGIISIQGKTIEKSHAYRRQIGYMPQNPDFPGNLLIRELFEMLEDIRLQTAPRKNELIKIFELEHSLNRPIGVLSGGTKQKVAAVAAFMFDPEFLILDEPTVGLDPVASVRLKRLIQDSASKGKTVLLVSHIMSEIEQIVNHLVFLLEGRVLFSGSLESLKTRTGQPRLEDAVVQILETSTAHPHSYNGDNESCSAPNEQLNPAVFCCKTQPGGAK